MPSSPAYTEQQRRYWSPCDEAHYQFQTHAPYFSQTEADLLASLHLAPGERLLEIGCGEGANLFHLGRRFPGAQLTGVDFSPGKVAAARRHLEEAGVPCTLRTGDAAHLPLASARFDAVLIRDLLHHLPDRDAALREATRVLRPGGRLLLIEPNARSPLVWLQAALIPAERGVLVSSAQRLRAELTRAGLQIQAIEPVQPLPLSRALLHPRFGVLRPRAPGSHQALALLSHFEALSERLVPRGAWLYLRCAALWAPASASSSPSSAMA